MTEYNEMNMILKNRLYGSDIDKLYRRHKHKYSKSKKRQHLG